LVYRRFPHLYGSLLLVAAFFCRMTAPANASYSSISINGQRCVVIAPEDVPPEAPVVLLLHGTGTSGEELIPLCDELGLPPCVFVLPDGPFRAAHGRTLGRAWYDPHTHDRKGIERSRDFLFSVLDYFTKDFPEPPRPGEAAVRRPVITLGFSQGAVMSLEVGLSYKGKVAAIVSMSGYLNDPVKTLAHPGANRTTPVLLTHGTEDPVVQEEDTQATLSALRKAGFHPVLKEFPVGHRLIHAMTEEVAVFLRKAMGNDRPF